MNRLSVLSREAIAALSWLLLGLVLPACSSTETEICSSGMACPPGRSCSADGQACIQGHCGDGIRQEAEACDDGNIRSGDGCNATCSSTEKCGNNELDPGEACDDGNNENEDSCSADCKHSAECGNRNLDMNEECDPPGERDGLRCSMGCKLTICGNKRTDEGEQCDDGNPINEDTCRNDCMWNTCGDGFRNPETEACDDGPATGTRTCPYGQRTCDVCNAGCTATEPGTGPYCGDGVVNSSLEKCDFGQACGTCSAQCEHVDSKAAEGRIKVVKTSKLSDGVIFIISDGFNLPVTFELCLPSSCDDHCEEDGYNLRHCYIKFTSGESEAKIAKDIKEVINFVNWNDWLDVQATKIEEPSTVVLENDSWEHMGTEGNQPLLTTDSRGALTLEGMSGGSGYDCPEHSPCLGDKDCKRPLMCDRGFCSSR